MAPPRKKYRGILLKPLHSDDVLEAYWERVVALADHYDVDLGENEWGIELAWRLAEDYVPGFRHAPLDLPKPDRVVRDAVLCIEVAKRRSEGHSVKRACQLVARARPDLGFKSSEALRVRYEGLTNPDDIRLAKQRAWMIEFLIRKFGPP